MIIQLLLKTENKNLIFSLTFYDSYTSTLLQDFIPKST